MGGKNRSSKTKIKKQNTDLSQFTDKLYYIMLYQVDFAWAVLELTTLVNQE
jgi:hypothetical protein